MSLRQLHAEIIGYENSAFQTFEVCDWDPAAIGWLAGILDGEGSFKIVRRQAGKKNGGGRLKGTTTYTCAITVGSIDFPIVAKCQEITNAGRLTEAWKQNRVRKLHIWEANGWQARAVALMVHGRLVAKRDQADLLLGPLNEESWQRLRELHGRGEVYGSDDI